MSAGFVLTNHVTPIQHNHCDLDCVLRNMKEKRLGLRDAQVYTLSGHPSEFTDSKGLGWSDHGKVDRSTFLEDTSIDTSC